MYFILFQLSFSFHVTIFLMNYYNPAISASVWMKAGETQHQSLFNQARLSLSACHII